MPVELTEASTKEDIQAAVDEIVETRNASEEVTDGQKIAEENDKPTGDMTAEEESGSEDTAAEGEESGEPDWMTDELKAEVAAYGIDEKDLNDYSSREELDRALRLFDKTALEAGRKAMAEGEEESGRDEKGRFAKDKPKEEEPKAKEGQYEVKLDKDIYDEDIIGEFTRLRDHYEDRLANLESRFAETDAKAEEDRFDMIIDALGHKDLFGKSGGESKKELERRQDLFVAVKAQQIGLERLGRPTELDESLVNRVARMVFAEELDKKELKKRTRQMSKQSNNRSGDSATRGSSPVESLRDEMRRRYKEMDGVG